MKYFRRGPWFYLDGDKGKEMLGHIEFQESRQGLYPVSNTTGNIIGFFDMVDSTFKPASENSYYITGREVF